ncbi:HSF-type DNA-binding-domain-containing protein, partial [Mycena latifolia]
MITSAQSSDFISWTELGTSFVVSNVGEFGRGILGRHFNHNNFSSFVRQLNMYGFHKINRTPRAQRTASDAQTWEFSHPKFLRGRPDLLDEIEPTALQPRPVPRRIELPGEVAAQLDALRDENQRLWEQLAAERRRVEELVSVAGRLWDVVGQHLPG